MRGVLANSGQLLENTDLNRFPFKVGTRCFFLDMCASKAPTGECVDDHRTAQTEHSRTVHKLSHCCLPKDLSPSLGFYVGLVNPFM